jgi:hypothetical protein
MRGSSNFTNTLGGGGGGTTTQTTEATASLMDMAFRSRISRAVANGNTADAVEAWREVQMRGLSLDGDTSVGLMSVCLNATVSGTRIMPRRNVGHQTVHTAIDAKHLLDVGFAVVDALVKNGSKGKGPPMAAFDIVSKVRRVRGGGGWKKKSRELI